MSLRDVPLTFREFVMHEELPLAVVLREVLEVLGARSDAVLFGAYAVNAYCDVARMTEEVDVLATDARALAEAVRAHLAERFHIAARVREVVADVGYRVYQVRKPANRHLVDARQVDALPPHVDVDGVRVLAPPDLVAMKVISLTQRQNRPKGGTDFADLQRLLLRFPALKAADGDVARKLVDMSAPDAACARWRELAEMPLEPDEDDGY